MKGLILKDLLNLKSYIKYLLVILALFACVSGFSGNISFIVTISSLFAAILPITAFSYDQQSKFDSFVQCFPVTRRQIVSARYLLAVIFACTGAILSILVASLVNILNNQPFTVSLLYLGYISFAVSVLLFSVMLPLTYQFGIEKGRVIMILVAFLPAILLMLLPQLGVHIPSEEQMTFLFKLSPVIVAVMLFLSYLISCNIYYKKEF